MPYSIRKVGRQYCLYLKDGNKKLGCHDTKEGAESQRRAIEMNKHAASKTIFLRSAACAADLRTATFEGQERVVVPVIALVEGVIWPINAPAPEFVPAETLSMIPQSWNGRPVFASIGHPINDEGNQVSGNTPNQLESAIGTIFNARTDGKRLLMEAWLDPTKAETQRVLSRVNAGQAIEVSVGAFVIEEDERGTFNGKQFDSTWRVIYPDHLAILPEGDEGACSCAMGCGLRAARMHTISADGKEVKYGEPLMNLKLMAANIKKFLTDIQDPAKDEFKELHAYGDGEVVYETASGKMYRQKYTEAEGIGDIVFDRDRVEVEPVMYYQPVLDIETAKGARHSAADMAKIQAMHNHTVDLGAQCSPKAMSAEHPCGCKDKAKERVMARTKEQREELVKNLRSRVDAKVIERLEAAKGGASSGDLVDAIIQGIQEKYKLSDAAAQDLANLEESTLVELAGMAAPEPKTPPADGKDGKETPPAPPADGAPKTNAAKPQTEEEFLAAAPQAIRDLVSDAKARETARREELVKTLKGVQKEYTEEELKKMSVKELERFARVCKAAVPAVDFGVNTPRDVEQTGDAPDPIDVTARIKANQSKK